MFERLKNWLALTATEQRVILFLAATFLIGAGIRLYQETFPSQQKFDYRSADSTFASLSESLRADTTENMDRTDDQLININSATKDKLMSLPGIGSVIAERIILFREDEGPFTSIDDLRKVKGVSTKKFQQLKARVTVR
jgi:competence protein ComEA